MGRKRHHGTRRFIITRFDTGTHETRAFPVRASSKAAALAQVEAAGMTSVQVQSVSGYYFRRVSLYGSMIGLGLAIAVAAITAVWWWQKNVTTYDALMGSTDLAITASKGEAEKPDDTKRPDPRDRQKPAGPSLTEQLHAARAQAQADLGDDQGLFESKTPKPQENRTDFLRFSPEQMLKLVSPIGQTHRSLISEDRSWIFGPDHDKNDRPLARSLDR
jgi:hypothetical protein